MKKVFTLPICLLLICTGSGINSQAQVIDGGRCPVATISYTGSPYCSDAGQATVSITGTRGGTYSSDPALVLDPVYGYVDLAASTSGTYTVTYTLPGSNGCPDLITTSDITITSAPTASFYYMGSPFCNGAGTASVNFTGTTGGIYSSDPGLTIDPSNGDINLELSNPGNYTVSYSVSNGNCSVIATSSITVTTQPNATITYAGSPYCSTAGTASVDISGTSGGSFSSDPGLVINSSTGDIDLASSTAGTYTINYYISSAGNCGDFTTSTVITILSGAKAQFSYPNSPYCPSHDTAMVAFAGTSGGTFASDPGLAIDSVTGTVNIQSSTPGNYVVYYNLSSSCGLMSNTASISINGAVCLTGKHLATPTNNLKNNSKSVPAEGQITLYPNPVTSRVIHLQLTGMADGMYSVKLVNGNGDEVLQKQILFHSGNGIQQIELPKKIVKGYYQMEILQPNGIKIIKAVVITE